MRYVLVALLIVLFGYSLALVLQNGTELSVDLCSLKFQPCVWGYCYYWPWHWVLLLDFYWVCRFSEYSRPAGKSSDCVKILTICAKSKFIRHSWQRLRRLQIHAMKNSGRYSSEWSFIYTFIVGAWIKLNGFIQGLQLEYLTLKSWSLKRFFIQSCFEMLSLIYKVL